MPREIPKAYEPRQIEQRWAQHWVDEQLFRAEASAEGPVFSIVIPPPNVTGSIHIGHMLEHTQIDILVRWRRMRGQRTLWLPGSDHAGIATQVVVERELAKQKLTRQQIGREEFERRVWDWKAQSGGTIKKQMIRLGDSCDWSRERFTLDPPLYRAVLEAFLRLYREGLIYRGRYIINWCPRCMTALSDLETVHQERAGRLWYIRYPVVGSKERIIVATTRPETMLGDTAVAVHPDDARYRHLVGKQALLPLMNREIPVVADAAVDREFGTGAVKVTPAHDPNDFEIARRHSLPEIDVMTEDAQMSAAAGKYAGLDRYAARKEVVAALEAAGLLEKVTDHTLAIGVCDRCKTPIEPRLSTQWFLKMKPLAEPAIRVVEDGTIPVVPENQKKIFLDWMGNIRDWCISRQLWWGHRIPIWHCGDCGALTPAPDSRVEVVNGRAQAASVPANCGACGGAKLTQDPDVLDTWFSAALWPFSTLGWPDDTADLRTYYPTSLLISGYDILFFWDARMIMMGLKFMGGVPFRALYLHSLVRDPEGLKMSKTRGNVIDPLEVIEKYGTDALRFTLAIMAAPGTDIALSEERILSYRAFANKIWNAARFILTNLSRLQEMGVDTTDMLRPAWGSGFLPRDYSRETRLADRWIFSRLWRTTRTINEALQEFRFHEAAHCLYHFFWHDFCDWYLEWVKPDISPHEHPTLSQMEAYQRLIQVFSGTIRLLHPFMPFITEELWSQLHEQGRPHGYAYRSLALENYAVMSREAEDRAAEEDMALLQEIIVAARNLRAELKLDPKRKVAAKLGAGVPVRTLVEQHFDAILRLGTLTELKLVDGHLDARGGIVRSTAQFDLKMAYGEAEDLRAELAKLRKEKDRLAKDLESKRQRLADQAFRSRAPQEIVRGLEATLEERQLEFQKLTDRLAELERHLGEAGAATP